MPTKTVTHQQVVDLVMSLPTDRLVSVYDFARFIKSHPLSSTADFFDATEDEIRADEEQWDQQFAASHEELRAIAREAAEEFRTGRTKPMEFTPEGRLVR
jgi:hypothetical protein